MVSLREVDRARADPSSKNWRIASSKLHCSHVAINIIIPVLIWCTLVHAKHSVDIHAFRGYSPTTLSYEFSRGASALEQTAFRDSLLRDGLYDSLPQRYHGAAPIDIDRMRAVECPMTAPDGKTERRVRFLRCTSYGYNPRTAVGGVAILADYSDELWEHIGTHERSRAAGLEAEPEALTEMESGWAVWNMLQQDPAHLRYAHVTMV